MLPSRAEGHKQALARIQRLCSLGIGSELIMPDLMREVISLCAAQHGVFCWTAASGATSDYYATFATASDLELYFKEFHAQNRERDLFKYVHLARHWPAVKPVLAWANLLAVDHSKWLRSDYYNLLWRPYDFYESIGLGVPEHGQMRHMLFVFRKSGQGPFGSRYMALLAHIGGFVAHSLTQVSLDEEAYAEGDDHALFVVDRSGKMLHIPLQAEFLLGRALAPRLSPALDWRAIREPSSAVLTLCKALTATADGEIGQPPPVVRLRNAWGEFVLRAYWLGPTDGTEQTRYIGITIERHVPLPLALHRRLERLPLTARERQIGLLLARNQSCRELADVMGIATSTAITHQRSLYAKLGVRNRVGLLSALQSPMRYE
jgi:DNA-binding CsgD family transcriptional regulator